MRGAKGPARPGHRSYPAATKHAFNHIHGLLIDAKALLLPWFEKKKRKNVDAFSFLEKGEVTRGYK
jgi:hypothetical protein